jgi:hypothetical protein
VATAVEHIEGGVATHTDLEPVAGTLVIDVTNKRSLPLLQSSSRIQGHSSNVAITHPSFVALLESAF